MFSSNHNIDKIYSILVDLKKYIELKGEFLQIDLVCKLSKIFTFVVAVTVISIILVLAIFFTSIVVAEFISSFFSCRLIGYGIIALLYFIMALVVYLNRKRWIERPVTNYIGNLFLK